MLSNAENICREIYGMSVDIGYEATFHICSVNRKDVHRTCDKCAHRHDIFKKNVKYKSIAKSKNINE